VPGAGDPGRRRGGGSALNPVGRPPPPCGPEPMSSAETKWPGVADSVAREALACHADDVDQHGRWPAESVAALAESGLLGLTVPRGLGGAGEGPRTFAAVTRTLAERCASTAMIYLMHVCAGQVIAAAEAFPLREAVLRDAARGRHLS